MDSSPSISEPLKLESPNPIPQQVSGTGGSTGGTPPAQKRPKPSTTPVPALQQQVPELPKDIKLSDVIGGSGLRKYINENLTLELLRGIKNCVNVRPERPLKWLGEWLILRDQELQGDLSQDAKMTE